MVTAGHDRAIRIYLRSNEPVILEEEREREMEEQMDMNMDILKQQQKIILNHLTLFLTLYIKEIVIML